MNLEECFEEFIWSRRFADLSAKTIDNYKSFIRPFINFLGSDSRLEELTQGRINEYVKKLLDKPISKATRATYIRHIKIFLKWVQENYTVNYDYKRIKIPKPPKKNVRIYDEIELKDIFEHIHAESEWLTLRNKCIIALMYDSGLRQSEVCTLERARVSFNKKSMVVRGKGSKERTVPLGSLTAHFMKSYMEQCPYESDMVFVNRRGEPLTCNAVKLLVSKLAKELPFELSSHKLRHNFATNYCIDQYETHGHIDIYRLMIILGHEDIETTRRYLHHAHEIIGAKNCISHLDMLLSGEN